MGHRRSKLRSGHLILRFVFCPTPADLELERKYGFDTVLRALRRDEVRDLLDAVLPYLPERGRGRPKGQAASTRTMLTALKARIKAGEPRTQAARALLAERGVRGDIKGRADYLVRLLKRAT
jgi:hypothetical protein